MGTKERREKEPPLPPKQYSSLVGKMASRGVKAESLWTPINQWWLPLYQPLNLCPQPWVLAHVIPSDGSPVPQEPQGLGSMAGGWWHPAGPPT